MSVQVEAIDVTADLCVPTHSVRMAVNVDRGSQALGCCINAEVSLSFG